MEMNTREASFRAGGGGAAGKRRCQHPSGFPRGGLHCLHVLEPRHGNRWLESKDGGDQPAAPQTPALRSPASFLLTQSSPVAPYVRLVWISADIRT